MENGLFLIKIFGCIILLILGYLGIDDFFNIFEDICEIFSLAKFDNLLEFTDSFSRSSAPAAIRNRDYFKAHFISQFFKIVEELFIDVKA